MESKLDRKIKYFLIITLFLVIGCWEYILTYPPKVETRRDIIIRERAEHYNKGWQYINDVDPATNKKFKLASTISKTIYFLSEPYNGASSLYVKIITQDNENRVFLKIDNGEFIDTKASIPITFKNDSLNFSTTKEFVFIKTPNYNNALYFLDSEEIIKMLLKSTQIDITVPIIQKEWATFNIPVGGLWQNKRL